MRKFIFISIILLFSCNQNVRDIKNKSNNNQSQKFIEIYSDAPSSTNNIVEALKCIDRVTSISIPFYKNTADSLLLLKNLIYLEVEDLVGINVEDFFRGIGKLEKLRSLYIHNACNINFIPEDIGILKQLQSLEINDTIINISDSFYTLKHLKSVKFYTYDLTSKFCSLSNLELIEISDPRKNYLPKFICCLKNLETINLHKQIEIIPDLKCLNKLQVVYCTGSNMHERLNKLSDKKRQLFYEQQYSKLPKDCKLKFVP